MAESDGRGGRHPPCRFRGGDVDWLRRAVCVALWAGLLYSVYDSAKKLSQGKVATYQQTKSAEYLPYPSVTMCPYEYSERTPTKNLTEGMRSYDGFYCPYCSDVATSRIRKYAINWRRPLASKAFLPQQLQRARKTVN